MALVLATALLPTLGAANATAATPANTTSTIGFTTGIRRQHTTSRLWQWQRKYPPTGVHKITK